MMNNLMTDLGEVGSAAGGNVSELTKPNISCSGKLDDDFTVARIYVSKIKSEVKSLSSVSHPRIILIYLFYLFMIILDVGQGETTIGRKVPYKDHSPRVSHLVVLQGNIPKHGSYMSSSFHTILGHS